MDRQGSPIIGNYSDSWEAAASNVFDVDVDAALKELGSPTAASTAAPPPTKTDAASISATNTLGYSSSDVAGANGTSGNSSSGALDPVVNGEQPADRQTSEQQGHGPNAADKGSAGSEDSDVIHIDLTQRPPPLPMSGLALEQLVSMLPGGCAQKPTPWK